MNSFRHRRKDDTGALGDQTLDLAAIMTEARFRRKQKLQEAFVQILRDCRGSIGETARMLAIVGMAHAQEKEEDIVVDEPEDTARPSEIVGGI